MTVFVFVGNTVPSVSATLTQVDPDTGDITPVPLGGVTATFRMRNQFGAAPLVEGLAVIVDQTAGKIRYDWTLANTTTDIDSSAGPYLAWWHLDYGGGVVLDTPEFPVDFLDHNPRRNVGPCTDWCSTQDVVSTYPDAAIGSFLTSAVRAASEVLYEKSAGSFAGWCQSQIRPCARTHGFPVGLSVLDRGHLVWGGHGWYDDAGEACQCGYLQQIELPGIAQRVIEVLISGQVVDPSSYRLDPDSRLIRTDGQAWPICQNMALAGDAVGAFQVTYAHGYTPPEVGRRAAVQLAYQFWLALSAKPCKLPSGVVSIVRQGLTITRVADLWGSGATGLALVDSFLAGYGASNVLVLSPDTMPTDRRTA